MDTKWKNRKKAISFILFFLGISLALGSMADILRGKPAGVHFWQADQLLEDDYQESSQFRSYIASRLENFLIMATGGDGLGGIWGYNNGTYYGGDYDGSYYYGNYYDDGGFYDRYGYRGFLTGSFAEAADSYAADSGNYPISAEELTEYLENLQYMQENYLYLLEAMEDLENDPEQFDSFLSELEAYRDEMENYIEYMEDNLPDRLTEEQIKPLTDEQKKKIAEKYHNNIKGDQNLLYSILYDGKVLYSNAGLIPAAGSAGGNTAAPDGSSPADGNSAPDSSSPDDGNSAPAGSSPAGSNSAPDGSSPDGSNSAPAGSSPAGSSITASGRGFSTAYGDIILPEGYNFLLYFDGTQARILKDGREIDVYGDGYYREGDDWYLPGYVNFQADGTVSKAAVCIAAAQEPVIFTQGTYGSGGAKQYDNPLYWMNLNVRNRRERLLESFVLLAFGLILLLFSFLMRKSRREAAQGIARFQAKIWLECKIVLLLVLFYGLYMLCNYSIATNFGYGLWEEFSYAFEYNYDFSNLSWFFREMAYNIPSLFWVLVFWGIWLLGNDLRYNKKIWRFSLTAKLFRTFSAKSLNQPLTRSMSHRNLALFLLAILYGLLALGGIILAGSPLRHRGNAWVGILLLAALGMVLFLIFQYLTGVKNMKIAEDVELLSRRITEIRNGNYTVPAGKGEENRGESDPVAPAAGHGLNAVMTQLEDIRHGMASAVDEQMKSERMKVELIANVSHDLKTPLTSIISYVEFLKQEKELPEHVKDYVKILDEKSQRLKNMVTDVFAVSKAASGELPMQMEELDYGKLLRQTLADMEEQIRNSAVTFRTDLPDAPVKIMADGQRLYRVFQNLFQNAIQYSLQGSRVYVTLQTNGQLAVASVKNTSQLELDKKKDFTERFTRGDLSRTDGGSGLGLSIAQSFTEACGGTFSWETDADLFVVKVSFPVL